MNVNYGPIYNLFFTRWRKARYADIYTKDTCDALTIRDEERDVYR